MPAPTKPTITVARVSSSSFSVTVDGDAGVTNRVYYRRWGTSTDLTDGTVVGDGSNTVGGLTDNASYLVWVVSDNGEYSLPAIGHVDLSSGGTLAATILTAWNNTPALIAAAGQLYLEEVPEYEDGSEVTLPYSALFVDKTDLEWTFETMYHERTGVEFYCYAAGGALAEEAARLVRRTFDWVFLGAVGSDGEHVESRPIDARVESLMVRDKLGRGVYRACVSYEMWVQRDRNL